MTLGSSVIAVISTLFLQVPAWTDRRLPPPPHLSDVVRDSIRTRMAQHGREMSELVWAVLFLQYRDVERLASSISSRTQLRADLQKDATNLNFPLPERFFELTAQLTARSGRLADMAKQRKGAEMGTAYGQLSETCVTCHSLYLNDATWKR